VDAAWGEFASGTAASDNSASGTDSTAAISTGWSCTAGGNQRAGTIDVVRTILESGETASTHISTHTSGPGRAAADRRRSTTAAGATSDHSAAGSCSRATPDSFAGHRAAESGCTAPDSGARDSASRDSETPGSAAACTVIATVINQDDERH
jgi:hypothetical protein